MGPNAEIDGPYVEIVRLYVLTVKLKMIGGKPKYVYEAL